MALNLTQTLKDICRKSDNFVYQDYYEQEDGVLVHVLGCRILYEGKESTLSINISEMPNDEIHLVLPLFEAGVVGEGVGVFYQLMSEVSAHLASGAKIVPYIWDNSNTPVIMLFGETYYLSEKWLHKQLEYLVDAYSIVKPVLALLISRLGLRSDRQARLSKGQYQQLLQTLRGLIESASPSDGDE